MASKDRGSIRNSRRRTTLAVLLALGLGAGPLLAAPPARAVPATFTVNTTADDDDFVCQPLSAGDCTLREAILDANANDGRDTIAFDIPGPGVKTIRPTSPLPAIRDPVTIDGYTQPGAKENTAKRGTNAKLRIELDGSLEPGDRPGLVVEQGPTTIRGLVINNFGTVGGGVGEGIALVGAGNADNVVEGNFLGTTPDGRAAQGNGSAGVVVVNATGTTIGGPTPGARNLISGNGNVGVLFQISNGNTVQGNLIGTDKTGRRDLGNGFEGGILVLGGSANFVTGNAIAFNGGDGVRVDGDAAKGNRILRNAISANDGEGIDLGDDDRTANDDGDLDDGPNRVQNFPLITSAATSEERTTIKGRLSSRPNRTDTIQLFANRSPNGAEGQTFLGEKRVSTDADGDATFTLKLRGKKRVPPGRAITATATDLGTEDTSELSPPKKVKRAR